MATHSSVFAWRILGTEEPGGLPSMGLHGVGHDWSDLAAAAAICIQGFPGVSDGKESAWNVGDLCDPWVRKIPCRREWQPTPVFLPGEFQGQRSLVSYIPWSCKDSDMTERLTHTHNLHSASLTAKVIWETWFSVCQPPEYRKVPWKELLGAKWPYPTMFSFISTSEIC